MRRDDRWPLILLCSFAALRVLIYSLAFPFFNNVDEQAHFDLVTKYSEGKIPRFLNGYSAEASLMIVRYSSPEFLNDGRPEPQWKKTADPRAVEAFQHFANHEASQPPLYYAGAAIWKMIGTIFGIRGPGVVFWIRLLNVPLIVVLVWLGYRAGYLLFPDDRFMRIGAAALISIMPEDIFYSVQNDVLSPVCFAAAFISLIRFSRAGLTVQKHGLIAGLALSATALVKISNWPVVFVALSFVVIRLLVLYRSQRLQAAAVVPVGLFFASACVPIAILLCWNLATFGDMSGTSAKVESLTWTSKPILRWFNHPIFLPKGAFIFTFELFASFWRGEFTWGGRRLAVAWLDYFYWAASLAFPIVGLVKSRKLPNELRRVIIFAACCFGSMIAFLVLLSISFDFGKCLYPSAASPFLVSGRLLMVALVPFLMLFLLGFGVLKNSRWLVLWGICLVVTATEIWIDSPAFSSPYNYFALIAGG